MEKKRELLFRVTASDCEWEYFRGSGKGGQKRNKTSNAVRCKHPPSGAVGVSQEERSQKLNKRKAFRHMAESEKFQAWLRLETARVTGQLAAAEQYAEAEINNQKHLIVEVKQDGKWVPEDKGV